MKHTFKTILVAAMAMLTVTITGCSKEESNNDNSAANGGNITETAEWVDLGLPSGLLWAKWNLGATTPEEYGSYFAWGETQPKAVYNFSTYRYCAAVDEDGDVITLSKYNTDTDYGTVDNLTTLEPSDDAATERIGNGARTPTKVDWEELLDNTSSEWTTQNGVAGRLFSASNGNSIFLPAAGTRFDSDLDGAGSDGGYWSATLTNFPPDALSISLRTVSSYVNGVSSRGVGHSVRAVCDTVN